MARPERRRADGQVVQAFPRNDRLWADRRTLEAFDSSRDFPAVDSSSIKVIGRLRKTPWQRFARCSARQQSWPEVGGSQRECFVSPATRRAMHGRRASTAPGSNARPPQTDPGVFCRKEAQKRSASEALEAPIGARTASSAGGILVPFCGHSFRALSAFVTTRCARRGCGASHARAATQKSRPASARSSYERSLAHACVQKVEPALRAGPGLTGIRHHSKCGSESRPHLQQAL
jgi:hypothetical protein